MLAHLAHRPAFSHDRHTATTRVISACNLQCCCLLLQDLREASNPSGSAYNWATAIDVNSEEPVSLLIFDAVEQKWTASQAVEMDRLVTDLPGLWDELPRLLP